jgi:hypothetical protein
MVQETYSIKLDDLEEVELSGVEKIKTLSHEVGIMKIIIPVPLKNTIRSKLWEMNINHATLFPGSEGFLKSLRYYLKFGKMSE